MTTLEHLFDGLFSLFAPKLKAPDKIEPQRTADIVPRRREITPKRAMRIQRLRDLKR